MNKEQQIEEIAKDINNSWFVKSNGDICGTNVKLKKNDIKMIAHQLVLEGYRKIPEDSVVLSREEYDNLKLELQKAHNKGVQVGFDMTKFKEQSIKNKASKETAEKIFKMLISELESNKFLYGKRIIMKVDVENLAKQFGVEEKK